MGFGAKNGVSVSKDPSASSPDPGACVLPAPVGFKGAFIACRKVLSELTSSLPKVRTDTGSGVSSFWDIDFPPPFFFPVQRKPGNLSQLRGFAQYRYCRKRS